MASNQTKGTLYLQMTRSRKHSQNIAGRYLDGLNIDRIERMHRFPIQGSISK